MTEEFWFPPGAFVKSDASDDALFYEQPRLVNHIDDRAIAALTEFYRTSLPPGGRLLDLMSSWVSHLPPDVVYSEVIGIGMNPVELAANPRLTRWWVQNLNVDARLPLEPASIDAAMICVSLQYLEKPVEVLAEVRRVLAPGGPLIVSFSDRCFPTKAVAIWQALDTAELAQLVELYMRRAGFGTAEVHVLVDGRASDPMIAVVGRNATVKPD
jgi:SAM-dependent methyltransferase